MNKHPFKKAMVVLAASAVCTSMTTALIAAADYSVSDNKRGISDMAHTYGGVGLLVSSNFGNNTTNDAIMCGLSAQNVFYDVYSGSSVVDSISFMDILNLDSFLILGSSYKYSYLSLATGNQSLAPVYVPALDKDDSGIYKLSVPAPSLATTYTTLKGCSAGDTIYVSVSSSESGPFYYSTSITSNGSSVGYNTTKGCCYKFTNGRTGESIIHNTNSNWGGTESFNASLPSTDNGRADVESSPFIYVSVDSTMVNLDALTVFDNENINPYSDISYSVYRDGVLYKVDDEGNDISLSFEDVVLGTGVFAVNREDAASHKWEIRPSSSTASNKYINAGANTAFEITSEASVVRVALPAVTQKTFTINITTNFPNDTFEAYYISSQPDGLAVLTATAVSAYNVAADKYYATFSLPAGNYKFKNLSDDIVSDVVEVKTTGTNSLTYPDIAVDNSAYIYELFDATTEAFVSVGYFLNTPIFEQGGWLFNDRLVLPDNIQGSSLYHMRVSDASGLDGEYWQYVYVNPDGTYEIRGGVSLLGDANNDGTVSIADAVVLQNFLLAKSKECHINADITGDGVLDAFDMVCLRKMLIS